MYLNVYIYPKSNVTYIYCYFSGFIRFTKNRRAKNLYSELTQRLLQRHPNLQETFR